MLDSGPIVGSFTVDGLTFAVTSESAVELVGVAPSVILSEGSEAAAPSATLSEAAEGGVVEGSDEGHASEAGVANLILPGFVTYEGADYALTSIAPYAFYLSGVTDVALPASVSDVDDRAFRSSDVANVAVADDNPAYSSYDGVLYDADLTSLLLIPGGRQGAVRISDKAEEVDASAFSHCAGVDAISVDADSAYLSSWEGLLYDADGTTLLRVPAGATEITIREGCTTIAAGALEACASLTTINAPATVTSISPDVFTSVPTVSLPTAAVILSGAVEDGEAEGSNEGHAGEANTQIAAMVALSTTDDDLPKVDSARIIVRLAHEWCGGVWKQAGFAAADVEANHLGVNGSDNDAPAIEGSLGEAETYGAHTFTIRNCMDEDSSDMFYYIACGVDTSKNSITLLRDAGSNHFNNKQFGLTPDSQWKMYNSPYGMVLVQMSTGKGFLVCKNAFNSSYPTTYTSASTFFSYYTSWECAYYVKLDGSTIKQPGNYRSFDWNEVSSVFVTPGPSILETYHRNDGTGSSFEKWMARGYRWTASPSVSRTGYTSQGWWTGATGGSKYCDMGGSTSSSSYSGIVSRTTKAYYARWTANSYTVEYWSKAGTARLSSDAGFKYDTARNLAAKPTSGVNAGYTAVGWAASANQSKATYGFGSSQKNLVASGTKKLYLAETANKITLAWNSQGGSTVASTSATYSPTAKVPMPATTTKAGYTFAGWWTAASGGTQVTSSTALPASNKTYYAHWSLNPYAITYDLAGGAVSGNPTTYDVTTTTFTLKNPTRTGYAFAGWSGTGLTGSANKTVTIAKGSTGNRAYTANWEPRISADVSRYVTLQLDILGMEGTPPAQGAIKSLCGEPLKVASVSFSPDQGAAELFGDNRKDVSVEGIAGAGASPGFSFPLDASVAEEADPTKLSAFTMAPLGTLDVAYRLSIAPDLHEAILAAIDPARFEGKTTSVCSVAYTVALANTAS